MDRLWVDLFPTVWSTFSTETQQELVTGLNKLLTLDMHTSQLMSSTHALWEDLDKEYKSWTIPTATPTLPFTLQNTSMYGTLPVTNGLQAILEALIRCTPQPRLPPTLLYYLTKIFGCGPQATILLERGMKEASTENEQNAYRQCLKEVLVRVNDDDDDDDDDDIFLGWIVYLPCRWNFKKTTHLQHCFLLPSQLKYPMVLPLSAMANTRLLK